MLHHTSTTARDFLRIWFNWKLQALFCAGIIVTGILVYSYVATPVYVAKAMVVLLPRTSEGSVISGGIEEKKISPVSLEDINTEIELMKCNDLSRATIQNLVAEGADFSLAKREKNIFIRWFWYSTGLYRKSLEIIGLTQKPDPFDAQTRTLENALNIKSKALSNTIDISLSAEDPVVAAHVLNRYLEIYIAHRNKVFTVQKGRAFIQNQATVFQQNLNNAEWALDSFRRISDIIDPDIQSQKMVLLASELEEEVKRIEIAKNELASFIALLEETIKQDAGTMVISSEMSKIPQIAEIEKALVPLLVKKSEVAATYTEQSREYKILENQINAFFRERARELSMALRGKRQDLEQLSSKRAFLLAKISEVKSIVMDMNKTKITLNKMERVVSLQKQNFMLYASKGEDARITEEKIGNNICNVAIADFAEPPKHWAFPNRLLMFFTAILFGLIAVVITPFIIEMFDMRIKTTSDVEQILKIPVICSIPEEKPSATN